MSNKCLTLSIPLSDLQLLQGFLSQALDTSKDTVDLTSEEVREVMRVLRTINERLRKTVDKTKEGEQFMTIVTLNSTYVLIGSTLYRNGELYTDSVVDHNDPIVGRQFLLVYTEGDRMRQIRTSTITGVSDGELEPS